MANTVKTYVLGNLETNTYVVENTATNECVVIDPALADTQLIKDLEGKCVKYVLLTHGHFDHIGGAKRISTQTGAKIAIHTADAEMLSDGRLSLYSLQYPTKGTKAFSADILLNDGDTLTFGDGEIKIMHTPGHTRGGVCYIFESDRLLFTGDTLFHLSAGRTDFPGGDARTELMSLAKIAEIEGDYKVFPGHNEETTLNFERENNRYMRTRFRRYD